MGLGHLHDRHGKSHAHVAVERDLDMMDSERLDLHAAEKVHVRCASVDFAQFKANGGFGDNLVVGIEQAGVLLEGPDASAPPCPEAQLEKSDGNLRCGDCPDYSDQSL